MQNNSYMNAIENEYKKINNRWLHLHFKIICGLSIIVFLTEIIMFFVLYNANCISISVPLYLLKYLFIPSALNGFCVLTSFLVIHSDDRCSDTIKKHVISIALVVICFVVFSIHSIFSSLYLIFSIPIVLTTVYGSYSLTSVTAACSIFLKTISELFVTWDPEKASVLESDMQAANFIISLVILAVIYIICIVIIRFEKEKNAASVKKELERYRLKQELRRDSLTSLFNRSVLQDALQKMETDSEDNTYVFVMIDLDNFKQINDMLGHIEGDKCLKAFGRILRDSCPEFAPVRFGGDEFCILFKNQPLESILRICKKIQEQINLLTETDGIPIVPTASFGIARYSKGMTSLRLLEEADHALYCAKQKKDSICIYGQGD